MIRLNGLLKESLKTLLQEYRESYAALMSKNLVLKTEVEHGRDLKASIKQLEKLIGEL